MSHSNRESASKPTHVEVLPITAPRLEQNKLLTNRSFALLLLGDLMPLTTIGILLLLQCWLMAPTWRGFYCDDESIRYPYRDDTIPSWLVIFIGASSNLIVIIVLEYRQFVQLKLVETIKFASLFKPLLQDHHERQKKPEPFCGQDHGQLPISDTTINNNNGERIVLSFSQSIKMKLLMSVYCRLMLFLFGALASTSITQLSKYSIGRLRPHFFNVCKPMISVLNLKGIPESIDGDYYCSQLTPAYRYLYIADYYCSGDRQKQLNAHLSFMSGHSSLAAYCATYFSVYLQSMLPDLPILRGSLQLISTLMALYTGLSRISDNKHHWSDVLAGLVQGTLVALLIAQYLWPCYRRKWVSYLIWPIEQDSLLRVKPVARTTLATNGNKSGSNYQQDYDPASANTSNNQLATNDISMSRDRRGHSWPDNNHLGEEQAIRLSYDEFVV